jgi:hypothetical protein
MLSGSSVLQAIVYSQKFAFSPSDIDVFVRGITGHQLAGHFPDGELPPSWVEHLNATKSVYVPPALLDAVRADESQTALWHLDRQLMADITNDYDTTRMTSRKYTGCGVLLNVVGVLTDAAWPTFLTTDFDLSCCAVAVEFAGGHWRFHAPFIDDLREYRMRLLPSATTTRVDRRIAKYQHRGFALVDDDEDDDDDDDDDEDEPSAALAPATKRRKASSK